MLKLFGTTAYKMTEQRNTLTMDYNVRTRHSFSEPTISVCIPTYRGKHLSKAIESALNQTRKANEIIVIDDCSPDNIKAIVFPYIKHGVIYTRNQKNQGVPANYNIALKHATSDYVMLHGDHDILLPTFIEHAADILDKNDNVGFVFWSTTTINEYGASVIEYRNKFPSVMRGIEVARLIVTSASIPMTLDCLIRRKALDKLEPWFDPSYGWYADHYLWLRLSTQWDVGFVEEPITMRRNYEDGHYLSDKGWYMHSICKRIREENWHLAYPNPSIASIRGKLRHSIVRDKECVLLLLSYRVHGVTRSDAFPPHDMKPYPFSLVGKIIALVIVLTPVKVLQFMSRVRKSRRKI
jgi:glycosyltransferase involved in cell wall biosynthesis